MERNWLMMSLLLGLCAAQRSEVTLKFDSSSSLFPLAQNATLTCYFDIPDADLEDVGVSWWVGSGANTVKIGKSRLNSNFSFKYLDAPSNVVLSSRRFGDGYADLIIKNIAIVDESIYACEVDDEVLHVAQKIEFPISVYNLPTVTIEDVDVDLDIRPPPLPKPEPTENLEMKNESLFSNDTETNPGSMNTTEEMIIAEEVTTQSMDVDLTTASVETDGYFTIVKCNVASAYPLPNNIVFHAKSPNTESSWNIEKNDFENSFKMNPDGTYNVTAELRIIPSANLDGAVFRCSAFVTSESKEAASDNESTPLQVKYLSDTIDINIAPSNTVNEGSQVTISCESNGNPLPKKYLALPIGEMVEVTDEPYSFVASRSNKGTYECSGAYTDYEGGVLDVGKLNVNWMEGPVIAGTTSAEEGGKISLKCAASSSLTVHYQWMKDDKFIGDRDTFEKENVDGTDSGEYVCEATATTTITARHQITVETICNPTISETVEAIPESEDVYSVKITCTASAIPECDMWMSGFGTYEPKGEKNEVVLEIPSMQKQKETVSFTCMASNKLSSKNTTLNLKEVCCTEAVSDGLPTGVVIVIVLIVIAVLAAIVGGVYYMKKQRTKEDPPAKKEKTIDDVEADKLNAPTEEANA